MNRLLRCAVALWPLAGQAETLFLEPFDYSAGELSAVSGGVWTVPPLNEGNPAAEVAEGVLVLDWGQVATEPPANGYYTHVFAPTRHDSGYLYARMRVTPREAPSAGTPGGASVNFGAFWNNGSGFRGNLWYGQAVDAAGEAVAGYVRFGLTDGQGSRSAIVWDEGAFPLDEIMELVLRYDLTAGVAGLYLDPSDETDLAVEVNDRSTLTIGGFGLRHKDDRPSIEGGRLEIDDLSISTTFAVASPDDHPPSGLVAAAIPGRAIGLSWTDNAQSESGYRVERREAGESAFTGIGRVGANVTAYVDEDVVGTGDYIYRVLAEGGGELAPSDEATATPYVFFAEAPVPETLAEMRADGGVALGVEAERQVSYQAYRSSDLVQWTRWGPPLGEGADAVLVEGPSVPLFFTFTSRVLDVPPGVGLSGPFRYPQTGSGATIAASDHGATPSMTADQGPKLQAALDAAQPGDMVVVAPGDYYVATRVTVPSGVIFRGATDGETRLLVADDLTACLYVRAGSEDIEILDFTIQAANASYESAVILNERYTTPQIQRVRIANLEIRGFARQGIDVRNARHVLVEGNTIRDATNLGGGGHGYGIQLRDDHNHDNWVRGNVVGPVLRHGVLLQYRAHNNLIEGNVAIDNTEDAYDLHGEDEYLNEFRGNLAYWRDPAEAAAISAAGFGIGNTGSTHAETGPGNWIHHNTVYNYTYGVDVILGSHFQYIDGNHFHDLRSAGVRISNGGANFVFLRDNLFETSPWGISAQGASHLEAEGNRFVGNTAGGINLSADSPHYRITGNDFHEQDNPLNLGTGEGAAYDNPGAD